MKSKARWVATFFVGLMCLSFLYPLYFMLINSFKSRLGYYVNMFGWPTADQWAFSNYVGMVSQFKIFSLFANTGRIVVTSLLFIIVLGVLCSYAFAKLRFRGRMLLYGVVVSTIFMPPQVTIIPLYSHFASLGIINTPLAVILPSIAGNLPQAILLMVAFFRGIPNELLEAGEIDGCTFVQRILHVVVPVGLPAIIINVISNAINLWNDLFTPMIMLQSLNDRTVMVALSTLMQRYTSDPAFQMCGLFIATVPALLVYVLLQKHIVKGITAGAIK